MSDPDDTGLLAVLETLSDSQHADAVHGSVISHWFREALIRIRTLETENAALRERVGELEGCIRAAEQVAEFCENPWDETALEILNILRGVAQDKDDEV